MTENWYWAVLLGSLVAAWGAAWVHTLLAPREEKEDI